MPNLSRSELAVYAACAVLIAILGWRALRHDTTSSASGQASTGRPAAVAVRREGSDASLVHVVGAVEHPGVYRVRAGGRVRDAIKIAGGARSNADLQAINLAAKVVDAQQVVVPRRATMAGATTGADGLAGAPAASVPGAPGATAVGPPINLNTATAEQLDQLDGVGPATARKILEYRTQHGGFKSVDDLAEVPGIGPKRLEALRPRVQA